MEPLQRRDPRSVGGYRILARIDVSGMATVYLGLSRGGRAAAVKVMHIASAREGELLRDRFRREVEISRTVGGVHSPSVFAADPGAATPWMATEFLPSVSLREAVDRFGPLPAPSVWRLAAGLAEALAAIHDAGVVHLDVKPANVLLTADGPQLIDFGIAAGAVATEQAGSWGFMSPEQVAGAAGPPSDIYSLGATLDYAHGQDNAGEALRALIADCRLPQASDRPKAADLVNRLAPTTRDAERLHAAWLPSPVMAAIDERASAADNPPMSPSPSPKRRRLLLTGSAAAACIALVVGVGAALRAATPDEPSTGSASNALRQNPSAVPGTSFSQPSPAPSPTPSGEAVALQFVITGDGPLTSLDYAVDGRFTRLKNVSLPWRRTIEVPGRPGSRDWRLRLTIPSGGIRYRVYVNGSKIKDSREPSNPTFGYPYDVDDSGVTATSEPLPDPAG